MKIQSDRHLTATEKKIIRHLLETGNSEAGTKNISIELKQDGENKFIARIYKYCAPALLALGFDLRPEMQIPKWNYTGKATIKIN